MSSDRCLFVRRVHQLQHFDGWPELPNINAALEHDQHRFNRLVLSLVALLLLLPRRSRNRSVPPRQAALPHQDLLRAVGRVPGVEGAGAVFLLPFQAGVVGADGRIVLEAEARDGPERDTRSGVAEESRLGEAAAAATAAATAAARGVHLAQLVIDSRLVDGELVAQR